MAEGITSVVSSSTSRCISRISLSPSLRISSSLCKNLTQAVKETTAQIARLNITQKPGSRRFSPNPHYECTGCIKKFAYKLFWNKKNPWCKGYCISESRVWLLARLCCTSISISSSCRITWLFCPSKSKSFCPMTSSYCVRPVCQKCIIIIITLQNLYRSLFYTIAHILGPCRRTIPQSSTTME